MAYQDLIAPDGVIYLSGTFTETMSDARRAVREVASTNPGATITLVISSPGGDVLGGFALLDELEECRQRYGVRFVGLVQGRAASMAVAVLQGCDERVAGSHSLLMTHGNSCTLSGSQESRRAYARADLLMTERLAGLYSRRTAPAGGADYEGWIEMLGTDTPQWYSAPEALAAGLIDKVNRCSSPSF